MLPKFALVSFPEEKHAKYVVDVVDIDFQPRSCEDFIPDQLYSVNWSVLRREESDTTSKPYSAKILLLAVSEESLLQKAEVAKLKLPQSFKAKMAKTCSSQVTHSLPPKVSSKRASKQVNAAKRLSTNQRMEELLQVFKRKDKKEKTQAASDATSSSGHVKKLFESPKKTAAEEMVLSSSHNSQSPKKRLASSSTNMVEPANKISKTSCSGDTQSLQDKIDDLEKLLGEERRMCQFALDKIKALEDLFKKAKGHCKDFAVKIEDKLAEAYVVQGKSMRPVEQNPEVLTQARTTSWVASTVAYSDAIQSGGFPVSPSQSSVPGTSPSKSLKSLTKTPTRSGLRHSPTKSIFHSPSKMLTNTSGNVKNVQKKNTMSNQLKPNEKDRFKISNVVLRALKHEETLPILETANTVKLGLGNNIWIKRSVWDDRLRKHQRKLSSLINDLAEEIWGYQKCATMSLKGGKSPKTPRVDTKPQAPAGAVEVILGVYLAHLKWQSMTNESHLESALKQGEGYLTSKLNESSRKVKKEKLAAKLKAAESHAELP